uniref:RRM domain-containing protein n=2 Tax=Cynoglossus semilaevis TaxID=244447 RepID=A0A3P8UL68_CYNSE
MCVTIKGNELTRVSVVDADGTCVLDELVKPANRIINYCTRYSGITAAMLRPVTTTLRNVQHKLKALLPRDAVLVGHSLNSDLVALKLIHRHVIDTSLLYRREFGQRFKLKVLAQVVLKKHIQTKKMLGHDSIEDAAAALEVAQYFINTGPRQVVERHLEQLWGEEITDTPTRQPQSLRFADVLQTRQQSVAYFGKRCEVALELSNQQWHNSDKEVLASFRKTTHNPFLSVLRFSSFSDHIQQCDAPQEQLHHRMCADLGQMCVVFAGPFPEGFSETEVKRLFLSCGPVRKIKMLKRTVRLHAQVEFQLLEGAVLALKTLDGLILHGQVLKVQRPVNSSVLDLDLTLDALMDDALSSRSIYAVRSKHRVAVGGNASAKVNGHTPGVGVPGALSKKTTNGLPPSGGNVTTVRLSKEEAIRETFGQLGAVERISLLAKPSTHAWIKFKSCDDKPTALAEDHRIGHYNICPCLTPPHLRSWTASAETTAAAEEHDSENNINHQGQEMELMMRKLDRYLGKLFRSVPDCTLLVVLFPGYNGCQEQLPGLCFLEVKSGSGEEQ